MSIQNVNSTEAQVARQNPLEDSQENSVSTEFSPSEIKAMLSSIVLQSGKITRHLKTATLPDLKALGALLTGDKNKEKRGKINNLASQARRGGALLACETELTENIAFKDGGLVMVKRPIKKESITEDLNPDIEGQELSGELAKNGAQEPSKLDLFEALFASMDWNEQSAVMSMMHDWGNLTTNDMTETA